jgi:hypothetical protein
MKVGICAIIKDCYEPYLKEWLNYHREIGVEQFYIYDNESTMPIAEMLDGTGYCGDLHVELITGPVKQIYAYHKCIQDIQSGLLPSCDRVAFIDEDEFINCENRDIKSTLAEYEEFSGLGISLRIFGSSGLKEQTPVPQREKFTQHTTPDYGPNQHIKSIVNPFWVKGPDHNPHSFIYLKDNCINVNKEVIEGPFTTPIYKKIWLDHYFTRSLAEWEEKVARGRSDIALTRNLSEFYETDFNCSGKTNKIHLVMPFYRMENKEKLIEAYRPMGVILHPILFWDEAAEFYSAHPEINAESAFESWVSDEPWILPFIIPMKSFECEAERPECFKRNKFIAGHIFNDDDYYVCVDDDDMYEPNVFDSVSQMDDDIVIISMKRGYQIPKGVETARRYHTSTLIAHPDNVKFACISGQQSFVKGKIFKQHTFDEDLFYWDCEIATHHKESGEQIAYRPDLFALFNYYEPGRWEKSKIAFGVMVNDPQRLDMVFGRSQLEGKAHLVKEPESATKGLNKLLDMMEADGAEIGVLCHQDMFFRNGWIDQLQSQIKLLPESWVVCGPIGKDMEGRVCGKFHDMRIPDVFNTSDLHTFPHPACCFDECVIIVNMKKKFRFNEEMKNFDLYGTLCVLQAWEAGGTAWVVDCFAEHYITRSFQWFPSPEFQKNYKWLYDKYHHLGRVDSTAIGTLKEDEAE